MLRYIFAFGLYRSGLIGVLRRLEHSRQRYNAGGSPWRLKRFNGSKFAILCYHRVGTEGVPLFSRLDPMVFAAQMRYVRKHYRIVSLGQFCAEIRDGALVPPTLAITFDDGYRDLYTYAFPVLREYKIPATIYLIGKCMDTGEAPWYDRIFAALATTTMSIAEIELDVVRHFVLSTPSSRLAAAWDIICYLRSIPNCARQEWCAAFEKRISIPEVLLKDRILTWHQARAMLKEGVSFGAHTMTHPVVSRLNASEMQDELGYSKSLIESHLDTEIRDFAYPFGKPADCSPAAEQLLSRLGYRSGVTTTTGVNLTFANSLSLSRLQIGDDRSIPSFALGLTKALLEVQTEARDLAAAADRGSAHEPKSQVRVY